MERLGEGRSGEGLSWLRGGGSFGSQGKKRLLAGQTKGNRDGRGAAAWRRDRFRVSLFFLLSKLAPSLCEFSSLLFFTVA
jgi:hypothetical protein